MLSTPSLSGPVTPSPSASSSGHLAPGTLLGDWRIERQIGEGGMGTVYAAVHQVIGKSAAIKVVRAELCTSSATAERFVQEARVVNQIGHPNIVDIFHVGRLDDGRPFLVMELLRGQTLATRLAEGRVPATEAIDLLLAICAAVSAAHQRGVIHRDLKPENVFLAEGAGMKIVDWGIAKLAQSATVTSTLTSEGHLIGTPQYVSPEQARGKAVDERADVYSLGAIAYELFLEEPPFTADNVADLVAMHLREPVPTPSDVWPDIPPALEQLLCAMLAKTPDQRPAVAEVAATLGAVREELESRTQSRRMSRRFAVGTDAPPIATVLDHTAPTPKRGGITGAWLLAIVVLGGFAIATLLAFSDARSEPATMLPMTIPTLAPIATPAPAPAPAPAPVAQAAPVHVAPAKVTPPAAKPPHHRRAVSRRPARAHDLDGTIDPFE